MYCQSCSLPEELYPEYVKRDNPGKWENDLRVHFKSRAIKTSTEHIKKCWGLQSSETFRLKKITLRYHFTPTKITKKGEKHQMLVRALRNRNSHPLLVGVLWKSVWWLFVQ